MRVSCIFAFACGLFSLATPVAAKVKGGRGKARWHRELKDDSEDKDNSKDKDDGDSDFPDLPDLEDIPCFSEKATVHLEGTAEPVSMKDLKVGDYVLTNDGSYQEVYAWGHYNPTQEALFYQLYAASIEEPLELTGEHLVYLHGKENPIRADTVQAGDILKTTESTSTVTKVDQVVREGVYTPLTVSGKIVVNDIHASSYISLQKNAPEFIQVQGVNMPMSQQEFVHIVLSPFRMLCMGISSSVCQSANEEGIPHYVANGMQFIRWADESQPLWIQVFILSVAFMVYGVTMFLENTVGASRAPAVVAVAGFVYGWMKLHGVSVRAHKPKTA